ncbi:Hypothetical protein PHPALM_19889 [Phytophthora palmivora]|uniref:Uncharacterized protein n=1 Tax=Phytophthora palmivora TaxID=4796 RepID=A0A2P4XG92_9STRA|nr:Hypothetical protein PHPALM_19889 [Phytophthora palmivora]
MTKGPNTLREDSPATTEGSPHAGIGAASFAGSADSAIVMTMGATADGSRSVQFEVEDAQGHASDEEKEDEDYEEKAELGYVKATAELLGKVGELSFQVDRMCRSKGTSAPCSESDTKCGYAECKQGVSATLRRDDERYE